MTDVGRGNQGEWWNWLNRNGRELAKKSKRPGVKGKRVKNRRAGMEKEIRSQEIELKKIKGRSGLGYKHRRDDSNRSVGYKFILVHKQKYCDSHSICKGKDQFPGQATNVTP